MKAITIFGRRFEYADDIPEVKIVSFLSKVEFDDETSCWNWTGSGCRRSGSTSMYGRFSYLGVQTTAHRFAWVALRGLLDPHKQLHHTCNNPRCVNPAHLLPVTPEEHLFRHTPSNHVAQRAGMEYCSRGHRLSGNNVRLWTDPDSGHIHRRCRTCIREWARRKYRKQHGVEEPHPLATHCEQGHRFSETNSYYWRGIRFCRTCHNINSAIYYAKKRERIIAERIPKPPRTHCKNGHPWIPENIKHYTSKGEPRVTCLICHREQTLRSYYNRRAKFGKHDPPPTGDRCRV